MTIDDVQLGRIAAAAFETWGSGDRATEYLEIREQVGGDAELLELLNAAGGRAAQLGQTFQCLAYMQANSAALDVWWSLAPGTVAGMAADIHEQIRRYGLDDARMRLRGIWGGFAGHVEQQLAAADAAGPAAIAADTATYEKLSIITRDARKWADLFAADTAPASGDPADTADTPV